MHKDLTVFQILVLTLTVCLGALSITLISLLIWPDDFGARLYLVGCWVIPLAGGGMAISNIRRNM